MVHWCENSAGDGSIFMASGWLGEGHGSLLKNSLYARFGPKSGPKTHRIGDFLQLLEPDF
jgi:hypothetical protein